MGIGGLATPHGRQLGLLEIGDDIGLLQWNRGKHGGARSHIRPKAHRAPANHAIDWRNDACP
ncbi:hypothetical protein FHX59_002412 [Paraburkholderia silvatlantica]|uniref:Uncharacterized protein n=1 Tax=Paraburkholderia silvatlantica TaxID=321895 RepID=A0ABR6FKP5_9BURK|nr:hypothetical protein [Paraburkholderia silvatlantica]PVY17636.1 hypothetical protein C7411_14819 [Paraburkholderia silvatlantica]PXW23548.1 hypothetical protein C7413_15219 [Paraburkholderia silvatlantica]